MHEKPEKQVEFDPAKLEVRGYVGSVGFHPPIKLDSKKAGLQFCETLADFLEPASVQFSDLKWTLNQSIGESVMGGLTIEVEPNSIGMNFNFPEWKLEVVESRYRMILEEFGKMFKPGLLLNSNAVVRATLKLGTDGDARKYLLGTVGRFSGPRVERWQRPAHLFGMHFFFPPFRREVAPKLTKSGRRSKRQPPPITTDWTADVRIESLMEDPSQLFLEVNSHWPNPEEWRKADTIDRAVSRMKTVKEFLEDRVLNFLRGNPEEDDERT